VRPKRALATIAYVVVASGIGSAVMIGTTASGSPKPSDPAAPYFAADPVLPTPSATPSPTATRKPHTTLHIPTTLHLIDRTVGQVRPSSSKIVISASLARPKNPNKLFGGAVYTCRVPSAGTLYCTSAFALPNGLLLGSQTFDGRAGTFSGKVIGGTGQYEGATGTMHGTRRSDGSLKITVDYSNS
jgi:hypothetical protein